MTLLFHLLWMLCGLATVVLAVAAARDWRRLTALAAGFAVGLSLAVSGQPDPTRVGAMAVGATALLLFRPRYAAGATAIGGVIAGLWVPLLQAQALPFMAAATLVGALVVLSIWLARRSVAFAPTHLVDEGLLAVGGLSIVAATLPSILDGWQTAVALAATSTRQGTIDLPIWTVAFILACTSLGGLYSLWSYR